MSLLQAAKLLFRPWYELEAETYYRDFLKENDAANLRLFVQEFGDSLAVPSAILAVGSSTYPLQHWENMKKFNRKHPDIKATETYRDLDLLIVPERENVHLRDIEQAVGEALQNMQFPYEEHKTTTAGISYVNALAFDEKNKPEKVIVSFVHFDYGLHSFSTTLRNETKLDLILGRDDLLEKNAEQKIASERKYKNAFSVLYRK